MLLTQTETHKVNSRLGKLGQKPGPGQRMIPRLEVSLEQNRDQVWLVRINGGLPMPATDIEVELWIRLQALQDYLRPHPIIQTEAKP